VSDFSPMDQSFALGSVTPNTGVPMGVPMSEVPSRLDVSAPELQFRTLSTPRDIAGIQHLRRQIQLPADVLAAPGFAALEKKETARASSLRWSGVTSPLAR
jgi:hypothetical protein